MVFTIAHHPKVAFCKMQIMLSAKQLTVEPQPLKYEHVYVSSYNAANVANVVCS